MPVLTNPQHEKFARLVASGLSLTKAYIKAGYSARGAQQNGSRLMLIDDVSLRVAELTIETTKRIQDGIVGRRVGEINHRLAEWQDRWEEIRNGLDLILGERGEYYREQVQAEDGEEPVYVPGGSSGLIVKDLKGKDADKPVYRIDPGVLRLYDLLLAYGRRAAIEKGDWIGKRQLIEDEDIVRPDLDKLNEAELKEFERLFNKAAPKAPKGSIQ
jgi:hypothetical protein